jgi:rhomboid protease GluP
VNEEGIAPVLCDRCAGRATARARRGLHTGTLRDYPVTAGLVAINVSVFVAMVATGSSIMNPSGPDLIRWGANWGVLTLGGEYWRLLSATFVHIGIIHIALNMWCLLYLGQLSERLFGKWQTFLIYVLTGVGGNLLSLAYEPTRFSAGASGAIFGLAGALLAGVRFGNLSITAGEKRSIFSSVILFAGFSFYMGMQGNVDNMCHLGGFVSGLIVGLPLALPSSSKAKHTMFQIITLAITATLLAAAGKELVQSHGRKFKVSVAFRSRDLATAIQVLEKVTASDPQNVDAQVALGFAYQATNQPQKAIAAFEQALKIDPDEADAKEALNQLRNEVPQPEKP